jgi:peptidoglycan/xylan/chitin deacetylase (PgdA/CDA1 family)
MEQAMASTFLISLDFELMWGVRDHADRNSYGHNILGVRQAVPRILSMFSELGIRCTWATVGFLFCDDKEELLASLPACVPTYKNPAFSNYSYLNEIGSSEQSDPYYYGKSLINEIKKYPGQEIGSHSFSHFYCLEAGQTIEQFGADTDAAIAVADRLGIKLRSYVFPRNQYNSEHLRLLESRGIKVFRGNERSWVYDATDGAGQTRIRRGYRLADHYLNLTGHHVYKAQHSGLLFEVPASRFLRPYSKRLAPLDPVRLTRITAAMDAAAASNSVFHLWWHPHNFGSNLDDNLSFLRRILMHFVRKRDGEGMRSANMGDFA